MVTAGPEHILHIATHMRQADRLEVYALSGLGPQEALTVSLETSPLAWTALLDQEPVCMFGVSPRGPTGAPWLLGTDRMDAFPASVGRFSKWGLRRMLEAHPVLENWSDARHESAHQWLRWLGFTLGEPQPMGVAGLPFVPFRMP
jgi:hypothetical protein